MIARRGWTISGPAGNERAVLPRLLEHRTVARRDVTAYLRRLHQWRRYLSRLWGRAAPRQDPRDTGRCVDDLISVALIVAFARQSDEATVPLARSLFHQKGLLTVADVCELVAQSARSDLLKAAMEPMPGAATCLVPKEVLATRWIHRISSATWKAYAGRIPVTAFGEFQQMCLARPPTASADTERRSGPSERYDKGAHYTPAPIVDYLTCNVLSGALGRLTPDEIRAKRILDPACGCGAFLVAALRYVFNALRGGEPGRRNRAAPLTVQERLDVLREMIFGGDVDARAVEWTRRSLVLAVWESCIADRVDAAHVEVRLAELSRNIRTADFLADAGPAGPTNQPPIPADIVLGAPPFVRLTHLHRSQPARIPEYRQRFESARNGQFDLYMLFMENAIRILSKAGWLGFSVSNSFLRSASGRGVRRVIARQARVLEIAEFEDSRIYPDATTQIALLIVQKCREELATRHVLVRGRGGLRAKLGGLLAPNAAGAPGVRIRHLAPGACSSETWRLETGPEARLAARIESVGVPLSRLPVDVRIGLCTGADTVFVLKPVSHEYSGKVLVEPQVRGARFELEAAALRPILRGRDIRAYERPVASALCVFPYEDDLRPIEERSFQTRYPLAYAYLAQYRTMLEKRRSGPKHRWYTFRNPPNPQMVRPPKLVAAGIDDGKGFTLDWDGGVLCSNSVLIVRPQDADISPYYLLGVLNSSLFRDFVQRRSPNLGAGRTVYRAGPLRQFPVVSPTAAELGGLCHDIAETARELLDSKPKPSRRAELEAAVDAAISQLYRLSGTQPQRSPQPSKRRTPLARPLRSE